MKQAKLMSQEFNFIKEEPHDEGTSYDGMQHPHPDEGLLGETTHLRDLPPPPHGYEVDSLFTDPSHQCQPRVRGPPEGSPVIGHSYEVPKVERCKSSPLLFAFSPATSPQVRK